MPVVVRRPRASADLSEIWEFIAEESVERADAFVDRIDAQFQALAAHPMMGRERSELAPRLRSVPMDRYLIFYEPLPDGIEVIRVLHGARDMGAQFRED